MLIFRVDGVCSLQELEYTTTDRWFCIRLGIKRNWFQVLCICVCACVFAEEGWEGCYETCRMGLTGDRIGGHWDGVNNQGQSSNSGIVNSYSSFRPSIENEEELDQWSEVGIVALEIPTKIMGEVKNLSGTGPLGIQLESVGKETVGITRYLVR